jgi:hypothetical protein
MTQLDKTAAAMLAKAITVICVRNGYLEDLHAGITPSSKTGDYSDVTVVTPYGEIPWKSVSRISDEEMKRLMKNVVNQVYTFLCRQHDPEFLHRFLKMGSNYSARWDEPEATDDFAPEGPSRRVPTRSKKKADSSTSRSLGRNKRDG